MATKIKAKSERVWALYKGDEFIADGTPREIARKTGKTFDHLMFMTRPTYAKRALTDKKYKTKGRLEMVELEDE
ncbi:hypothetical protein D0505_01855 [Leuconostoc mesenteroides]|uniref:hypothetical protein n=1 Tax=Leuconostoc mesenteroides TaxID=1245 RepID=UPI0021BFDEAB|nr:hypothetical protein [Leuconostoc mesenteroides]MCT8383361.1 hypothetical protein [Leuconostoc mesenteroides]